jgi:hypothetical protein
MIGAKRKTASAAALQCHKKDTNQAAIAAAFFRFLRQPSRPNAPRPVADHPQP